MMANFSDVTVCVRRLKPWLHFTSLAAAVLILIVILCDVIWHIIALMASDEKNIDMILQCLSSVFKSGFNPLYLPK